MRDQPRPDAPTPKLLADVELVEIGDQATGRVAHLNAPRQPGRLGRVPGTERERRGICEERRWCAVDEAFGELGQHCAEHLDEHPAVVERQLSNLHIAILPAHSTAALETCQPRPDAFGGRSQPVNATPSNS